MVGADLVRRVGAVFSVPAAAFQWIAGASKSKTPTILQMEWVECGAASLAMVLAYYGLWIPLEQLRVNCGVSRDGTKASNILKAARRFGLSAKGFRKEPDTLDELPMPSIIHWKFNHFVVLERLNDKFAYINDPAVGRRRVDLNEFDASFTGVVLAMEPGPNFRPAGRKPAVFPLLTQALAHSKSAVVLLLALSVALAVPGIVIPAFTKIFVDDILVRNLGGWFAPLVVGMAVTAAGRALVSGMQQSSLLRLQTKLGVSMAGRFLWHLMSLPMEFFTQRHAGDVTSRVAANEQVARLLAGGLATNALNLVSLVFFAAVMMFFDFTLATICIGMALLSAVVLKLVSRPLEELNRNVAVERGRLYGSTIGLVGRISGEASKSESKGRHICHRARRVSGILCGHDNRRYSWRRRRARDRRRNDNWQRGGLPIADAELRRPHQRIGPVCGRVPGGQGGTHASGGCSQLPSRKCGARDAGLREHAAQIVRAH